MTRRRRILMEVALALAGATPSALAQIPGYVRWEVSLDDGATWQGGEVVARTDQTSAAVRMLVGWDPAVGGGPPFTWLAATRFGSTIKIDRVEDTSPPGVGSVWIQVGGGGGVTGVPTVGNPVKAFRYSLTLDGSLGRRDIAGIWQRFPSGLPYIDLTTGTISATFENASIVVPTPVAAGPCAIALLACGAMRRRRQSLVGA
jgi:hypothetical protein